MKAMVYTRYGPPEVLHPADVPKPVPLSFWIPARLALGILTPRRSILGGELAGDIEEVGTDVVRFNARTDRNGRRLLVGHVRRLQGDDAGFGKARVLGVAAGFMRVSAKT